MNDHLLTFIKTGIYPASNINLIDIQVNLTKTFVF